MVQKLLFQEMDCPTRGLSLRLGRSRKNSACPLNQTAVARSEFPSSLQAPIQKLDESAGYIFLRSHGSKGFSFQATLVCSKKMLSLGSLWFPRSTNEDSQLPVCPLDIRRDLFDLSIDIIAIRRARF
jgi:hypothetical protein